MKKTIGAGVLAITLALFAANAVMAEDVTATTIVPATCGITVTSPIAFGSLVPGVTSGDVTSTISMLEDNTEVTPTVEGTGWTGTLPPNAMLVSQTHWSLTPGTPYGDMFTLTGGPIGLGDTVDFGDPLTVYFKMSVPAGQPADTYAQTITFTTTC